MGKFQVIGDKEKLVVLPFGDKEAVMDYLDELWADQAMKKFKETKDHKFHPIEELDKWLDEDDQELMQG